MLRDSLHRRGETGWTRCLQSGKIKATPAGGTGSDGGKHPVGTATHFRRAEAGKFVKIGHHVFLVDGA